MGCVVRLLSSRRAGTQGKKKTKQPCVRGADATDFAFTTLRLNWPCSLRHYFRPVALSISTQCLSSSILLFIDMFTFCFTLARTHQDGLIWAHIRRGYSSGQLHSSCTSILVFSRGFTKPYPDYLCFPQPCGLVSDYNPGWSHTRHSVSPFSLTFVDSCQPPSLPITVYTLHRPLFLLTLS